MRIGFTDHRAVMRALVVSTVGALSGVVVLGGSPAGAGQASVANACWSSFESRYRDLTLTFTGDATAAQGTSVLLSGVAVSVTLPDFLPLGAYNTGALSVGANSIPAVVYVAIAGTGTAEPTQVVNVEVTASTTITDPDGSPGTGDETATPIAATAALADTTWERTGTDPVDFRQAGPNTLPQIPGVGGGGRTATPTGSVFFSALLSGLRVSFDCRPGSTTVGDVTGYNPGTADPFAVLGASGLTTTAPGGVTTTAPGEVTTTVPGGVTTTVAVSTTVSGGSTTVPTSSGVVQLAPTTTTPRTGTTAAGSGAGSGSSQRLANTGLAVGLEAATGIVVADLGYLAWSSTHGGRRWPERRRLPRRRRYRSGS